MLEKNNNFRVLRIFFDKPEASFHIRELARLTRLSPPAIMDIVDKLSRRGLLLSKKEGILRKVHASRTDKFIQTKRFFNLYLLYESDFVNFLREKYEEPTIVLFGSYSRGEDISTSDIDIAVITSKEIDLDLKKFESFLKKKINIQEIKIKLAEKDFLNTLANGIVLYGYLELLK